MLVDAGDNERAYTQHSDSKLQNGSPHLSQLGLPSYTFYFDRSAVLLCIIILECSLLGTPAVGH